MSEGISRRDLLKFGGIAAAGVAGAGALNGCSPKSTGGKSKNAAGDAATEKTVSAGHDRTGLPRFFEKPAAIADIKETKDYDVVVIGAGAPGVPLSLIHI